MNGTNGAGFDAFFILRTSTAPDTTADIAPIVYTGCAADVAKPGGPRRRGEIPGGLRATVRGRWR